MEEIAQYLALNEDTVRKVLREMWAKGSVMRYPKRQGNTMLYHVGERRSVDRDDRLVDRPSDRPENSTNTGKTEASDRSIAKNEQISLLQNPKNGDRPIITPLKSSETLKKDVDRDVDRPAIDITIDPPLIENAIDIGDLVAPNATSIWHRNGSDKLPWQKVPKSYRNAGTIPINVFEGELFFELTDMSRVIGINGDRVKVRNQSTGRTLSPN